MPGKEKLLAGRVAIVTGAGKGLGRAYALHLASIGARLVVNNRTANDAPGDSSADAVVREIQAAGGEAVADYTSVEEAGAGERVVAAALGHFGGLDIVVSNAGIDRASSFHKQDMVDFETVMQVNFFAVVRLLHAAWSHLRESGYGRIVVSTSSAGLYGNHGQAAYASSKAALLGLARTLAIEGASRGVRVNAIAPYAVTQMTRPWFPRDAVQRFSPDAVAGLVGWLAGDACKLTGATLIAGANHVRLVRLLETGSLNLGDSSRAILDQLEALHCDGSSPATAAAEFEEFVLSLEK